MSQLHQSKSSVASRTAFDVLSVESGEESEDEVVSEPEAVVSAVVCVESSSRLHFRGSFKCLQRDTGQSIQEKGCEGVPSRKEATEPCTSFRG